MGYRVDYQPIKKVRDIQKRTVRLPALTALFLLIFWILVNSVWPSGTTVLRGLLFSGNSTVTAAALNEMVIELRSGEALPSALEAFCGKVIRES